MDRVLPHHRPEVILRSGFVLSQVYFHVEPFPELVSLFLGLLSRPAKSRCGSRASTISEQRDPFSQRHMY